VAEMVVPCWFLSVGSCKENMEKHLEQSVLSKLPYGYDSVTRQSLSSTEDDMGTPLDLEKLACFFVMIYYIACL
jgi:hypothetical protein